MLYTYVDTNLDDNIICCICRTPFNEPVTTRTCFHTFCQECILQALRVSNHCPIDRSPLSVELLGQADPIVRHLVEELAVRCPHVDAGCEYTGERHLLEPHLKLQCPYVQVPCPCSDEDCKRTVAKKDVVEGKPIVHQESDPELDNIQTAACEACGKDLPSVSTMKDHLANSCPEKIVVCRQADNGCTWRGRRVSLETHIDKCPYESIKGFFAIHSTQLAQVSKDNERLRCRNDELEGTIRILRQELEWAKIALGPWYRPIYPERPAMPVSRTRRLNDEGVGSGSEPSRVAPILLQGVDPASGASRLEPRAESGIIGAFDLFDPFSFVGQRQHHVSTATGVVDTATSYNSSDHGIGTHDINDRNRDATYESGPSGSGSSNGSGSTHEVTLSSGPSNLQSTSAAPALVLFSDQFPSEDQVVFEEGGPSSRTQGWQHTSSPLNPMPPNPSLGVHSPPPIHPHLASSQSARPQFTPNMNKQVVAPLNLSTTVEGSLVGLRESLVTLSAALESQGRRLELALTTEGLRFSEEVGSLKAIVQGLRMQVHAIMMDRNTLVTGRIGGVLNMPSNLGGRPQQSSGLGGTASEEDSNEDHGLRMSEESGHSPGGPRFMEGYYGGGGLWGFPTQQPVPPGVAMGMMGPNFAVGPPHAGVRFSQGGVLPMGGLAMGPLSPHHLYMSSTVGSGPKL